MQQKYFFVSPNEVFSICIDIPQGMCLFLTFRPQAFFKKMNLNKTLACPKRFQHLCITNHISSIKDYPALQLEFFEENRCCLYFCICTL